MVNLPIEQRILHYFLAMGAKQETSEKVDDSAFCFTLGTERIAVHIISPDDMLQVNHVLEVLMKLARRCQEMDQIYAVAPRVLGACLDAGVLRSQGIGLILFDDRRIEETIKPQFIPAQTNHPAPSVNQSVLTELASLKSMYAQLERTLESMRIELNSRRPLAPDHTPKPDPRPQDFTFNPVMRSEQPQEILQPQGPLPTFFTNNPWLEVLSKRGRAEAMPLAC